MDHGAKPLFPNTSRKEHAKTTAFFPGLRNQHVCEGLKILCHYLIFFMRLSYHFVFIYLKPGFWNKLLPKYLLSWCLFFAQRSKTFWLWLFMASHAPFRPTWKRVKTCRVMTVLINHPGLIYMSGRPVLVSTFFCGLTKICPVYFEIISSRFSCSMLRCNY